VSAEPNYLETLYKDLALALGDAVWAFARVEYLVYEYLGHLSSDRVDELVGDMNFRARANILKKLIERRSTGKGKLDRALSALQKAESLGDRRNIIVHNPWRIWVDLDAKKFMTEIQKYSNRNKKINLNDLRQFAEDAGAVEEELREALNAL
jgi:hypothetical protein